MSNRRQIKTSAICGCFYCLETFPADAIEEWVDVDEDSGLGQTAICPFCGIDSVVGFPADYTDVEKHLKQRQERSFG